jgi:hypothetical protein
VSHEAARRDYGVVLDEQTLEIDHEGTERMRAGAVRPGPTPR